MSVTGTENKMAEYNTKSPHKKVGNGIIERRWRWTSHVLIIDTNSIFSLALILKPEGKRKIERTKTVWRRTVKTELNSLGRNSWNTA